MNAIRLEVSGMNDITFMTLSSCHSVCGSEMIVNEE